MHVRSISGSSRYNSLFVDQVKAMEAQFQHQEREALKAKERSHSVGGAGLELASSAFPGTMGSVKKDKDKERSILCNSAQDEIHYTDISQRSPFRVFDDASGAHQDLFQLSI